MCKVAPPGRKADLPDLARGSFAKEGGGLERVKVEEAVGMGEMAGNLNPKLGYSETHAAMVAPGFS